jgi:leucyl aminopeptidase (aminopeptidase T)
MFINICRVIRQKSTKVSSGEMQMNLKKVSSKVIRECMGVIADERVLIIADTNKQHIGEALFNAAIEVKSEAMYILMLPRSRHGEEPPVGIAKLMKNVDVVVAPTSYSLTHTQARREASKEGVRIATMPGITEKMLLKGGMTADFQVVRDRIEQTFEKVKTANTAHIVTALGTDLKMDISPERWVKDTGILRDGGEYGNLPAGELFLAPNEGTANGMLVVDGAMAGVPKLDEPIKITIRDGFAEKIEGGAGAHRLREILIMASEKLKEEGEDPQLVFNIAELGIGMNDKAKVIGSPLEDEKVLGTVHVALGDNSTFGGTVQAGVHLDGIIMNPTLKLDNLELIKNGELLL